jgi:3-dehydroquinate synthase
MIERVDLSLGYSVHVAPGLAGLGSALSALRRPGRCVLVTDTTVAPLYADACAVELGGSGWVVERVTLAAGEANKTLDTWRRCVEEILALGVDRDTPVVALGGGVVGDTAGFAAATVLRGLPLVQVPTTLLAMVDASVGGKTGVNTQRGKNLVGAFWQPLLVWCPLATLRTLPPEHFRSGLGEVLKHALVSGDPSLRALGLLAPDLRSREIAATKVAVLSSVRCKARVVDSDPFESGRRVVLNLGHTVGHAIEAAEGFGARPHGLAVAHGILVEARWARGEVPGVDPHLVGAVAAAIDALDLRGEAPDPALRGEMLAAVGIDKKRRRGTIQLAVPFAEGDVRVLPVDVSALASLVDASWDPAP